MSSERGGWIEISSVLGIMGLCMMMLCSAAVGAGLLSVYHGAPYLVVNSVRCIVGDSSVSHACMTNSPSKTLFAVLFLNRRVV